LAGRSLVVSAAHTYSSPGYGSCSATKTNQSRGFEPCLNGSGAQKTSPRR
jgi:hypothetical protein